MTEGPLSIESIERLYWLTFFSETSPFQIRDKYECPFIAGKTGPPYLLEDKITKRKVYLGASVTVHDLWDKQNLDVIFDGIDVEEDCFSILFPLAKITGNRLLLFGKWVLSGVGSLFNIQVSKVVGHATMVIIEKKYNKIKIFTLDPKACSFDDSYLLSFLKLVKKRIAPKNDKLVEINRIFCGFQSLIDNTHCVYFIFKMIYAYLCGEIFCSNSYLLTFWLEFCFLAKSFQNAFFGCNNELIGTSKSCLYKTEVSFVWNLLNPSYDDNEEDKLSILSMSSSNDFTNEAGFSFSS